MESNTLVSRLFRLNPEAKTPAVEMRDDVDYVPIDWKFLLGQHFSAIAAAGPIVGPILAGVMFGWAPALLWLLIGSVFIGGVHDLGALMASVRRRRRPGEFFLEVRESNLAARDLFRKLGFEQVGVRPGYYDHPAEAAIVMRVRSC